MKDYQKKGDGMGIAKHRKSGRVPSNKANAIQRAREVNRQIEAEAGEKKKNRGEWKENIKDLF